MKFYLSSLLLILIFASTLGLLRAEEAELTKKREDTINHFWRVLRIDQKDVAAFLKEHRQEMFQAAEAVLDNSLVEPSWRGTFFHAVFGRIQSGYPGSDAEMQKTLIKEAEAFYEKYRTNEHDREACEDFLEALHILPIRMKVAKILTQYTEPPPFEEQRQALLELSKTLEPLKLEQGGYAYHLVAALTLNGMGPVNRQLSDRTQRKTIIPVLETLSKLFASKNNGSLKQNAMILDQMAQRAKSDGKSCPWDDMPFTTLDGQKKKIVDFRGKPLVLAFQPTDGPWIELLKDCAEHWQSQNLQILLITSIQEKSMKKLVEVCDIPFPVWNLQSFPQKEEPNAPLPPQRSAPTPNAMLIDADGKVVNSFIPHSNLAAEIGQLFGAAANDAAVKEVQDKSQKFLNEIQSKKLLDIPEAATVEQMHRRFEAALTDLLTPSFNTLRPTMLLAAADLPELVDRIVAKTDDRKMIESLYDGMLFLAKSQPLVSAQLPDFVTNLIEKARQQNLPKIAAEAQLIDFGSKFKKIEETDLPRTRNASISDTLAHARILKSFADLCDESFDFIRKSHSDYEPDSILTLLRIIGWGIHRYPEKLQIETYQKMANVLEETNEPSLKKTAEMCRGVVNRLQLLGKEFLIEGETIDGKAFDPQAYKGKVVLIDFWATWCGPCIAEVPNMKKAYEKYHDKGFEIVAISIDEDLDALKEYLEEKPLPWICLADELVVKSGKTPMKLRYGVQAIPTMILVGQDGRVALLEARGQNLTDKLEELLGKSSH